MNELCIRILSHQKHKRRIDQKSISENEKYSKIQL